MSIPEPGEIADGIEQASGGRQFRLKDFEGPLDLLLYLIRKNEVNIYDIPVAAITEQYLGYLDSGDGVDLDDLSEFYNLAATLLYIKSRMLLPDPVLPEDELDDPRRELIDKLIEYQRFRKLSELMVEKEMEVEWTVERSTMQRPLPFAADESVDLWQDLDVWQLLKAFSSLVRNMSSERIVDMYEEVSINEKFALIAEKLAAAPSFSFTELITRPRSALDLACAFLALLEGVKYRMFRLRQHRLFGDILIFRTEPETAHVRNP